MSQILCGTTAQRNVAAASGITSTFPASFSCSMRASVSTCSFASALLLKSTTVVYNQPPAVSDIETDFSYVHASTWAALTGIWSFDGATAVYERPQDPAASPMAQGA